MEIGSYLELDLLSSTEYYQEEEVARLNTARAGIFHCVLKLNCKKIYLPYYECFTVRDFLLTKGIEVKYYNLTEGFDPELPRIEEDAAILFVNYFGIMSHNRMSMLISAYKNVIIDNAQSFYSLPFDHCYNVYSPRKFFGVPDGCYVIGPDACQGIEQYEEDFSANTANFLFERIEVGCNKAYQSRMKNEERLDQSDILRMSKLTQKLLMNVPYEIIKQKRKDNFNYAHSVFKEINLMDPLMHFDNDCVPLVYPLVVNNVDIVEELKKNGIYTGRWWNYLLKETNKESFEYKLSTKMVPIPIDQRYGHDEINYVFSIINKNIK